jgi:5'-phosphate synthase pdxT subunit
MNVMAPLVGILALQGDYAAHRAMLERLGARTRSVRTAADLEDLAGLVIPGGESTTILRLLERNGLRTGLAAFAAARPTFGTCAGLILLAREVTNPAQESLRVLDVAVERNAYGRQIDSFVGTVSAAALGGVVEGVFIRAPRITRLGGKVEVLGRLAAESGTAPAGEAVLVREGHLLGATFHPELTADPRIHRFFLEQVIGGPDGGRPGAAAAERGPS